MFRWRVFVMKSGKTPEPACAVLHASSTPKSVDVVYPSTNTRSQSNSVDASEASAETKSLELGIAGIGCTRRKSPVTRVSLDVPRVIGTPVEAPVTGMTGVKVSAEVMVTG